MYQHKYKSWQEYFQTTFALTEKYSRIELTMHGQTKRERYVLNDSINETKIEVGYLYDKLILLQYINPRTPGFTEQQKREYFYRYDFTDGKSYGGPGLEFIDINIEAITKQLIQGLKGKEIQYYNNEKLIKSTLVFSFDNEKESYPHTIFFEKRGLLTKLASLFSNQTQQHLTVKEIDLKEVFSGLCN